MYEKYGEFDSVEELNRAAEERLAAGDVDAVRGIAAENGIDPENAEDFINGDMEWAGLATVTEAAFGKLDAECADLKIKGVLKDWVDELKLYCMESEVFARAVRRKGKDLAGFVALTAEAGYKNRAVVDKRIVAKCPTIKGIIGNHEFSIGIPDRAERKELARTYYMG